MELSKPCAPNCRRTSLVTMVTVTCLVNRENSNFLLICEPQKIAYIQVCILTSMMNWEQAGIYTVII